MSADLEDFFVPNVGPRLSLADPSVPVPELNPVPDLSMHTVTISRLAVWEYGGMLDEQNSALSSVLHTHLSISLPGTPSIHHGSSSARPARRATPHDDEAP